VTRVLDSLKHRELIYIVASKFFESEGDVLVDIVAIVAKGFEGYARDSHAHSLMITLCGLLISFP
jgi:hypothetical protein